MSDDRFFDEFADDFYAESTEHLAALRRGLLVLEDDALALRVPHQRVLSDVARSLHTLKGLTGMVGLAEAATAAHAMEEALRAAHAAGGVSNRAAISALFDGAQALENLLAAYRTGERPSDISGVLEDLRAVSPNGPAKAHGEPLSEGQSGQPVIFSFVPTPALAERGINVELTRARLGALGEIAAVSPKVTEQGAISFEFTVLMHAAQQPDPSWLEDGLSWHTPAVSPDTPEAATAPVDRRALRSNLIRVDLARLDELMLIVGELIMTRARLSDGVEQLRTDRSNRTFNLIDDASELFERQLRDLRAALMRTRLIQMGEVFERMRFVVRDIAAESGKHARVRSTGGATNIDKAVVDRMNEPLLHLVRNAVSHGLETAEERAAAGKNPVGEITLHADSIGDMILVQVRDDGRGLDFNRIREIATRRGILKPDETVSNANVLDILATPGFSTSATATMASGRGVGMEVVRATVRELGGELFVESEAGRGTCFTIHLPLTLMIVDALLVAVGDQVVAVPQPSLREVLRVERSEITVVENNQIMSYRAGVLPLLRLAELFGSDGAAPMVQHVLVVGNDDTHKIGIAVDRVVGLREIVVRSISDPLVTVPGIGGAAELSDGSVTLILDVNGLVRYALDKKAVTA